MLAIILAGTSSSASQPLTISINGTVVSTPQDIEVAEGQVMVPLRWAAEQLGARSILWDPEKHNITIKTNEEFYKIKKLASYERGLELRSADKEAEMWPLPGSIQKIELPHLIDRKLVLDLRQRNREIIINPPPTIESLKSSSTIDFVTITLSNDQEAYEDSYAVYSIENHNGFIYVPMDWLEELFYADVNYYQATNQLVIQSLDLGKINHQIETIEDTLVPATPRGGSEAVGQGRTDPERRSAIRGFVAKAAPTSGSANSSIGLGYRRFKPLGRTYYNKREKAA